MGGGGWYSSSTLDDASNSDTNIELAATFEMTDLNSNGVSTGVTSHGVGLLEDCGNLRQNDRLRGSCRILESHS